MAKRILVFIILIIIAAGAYIGYKFYLTRDSYIQQIYLVPHNAIYILQTNEPVKNWNKFSGSDLWKHLKQHPKFADITKSADALDDFLKKYSSLLGSVGSRDFTMSAHMTKRNDYDFLFIADLQKASKLEILKSQSESIFRSMGYRVTYRMYKENEIVELYDKEDRETLFLTIISNQLVSSYAGVLVEAAIDEYKDPKIGRETKFIEVQQSIADKGLGKLFINYQYADDFLGCYMDDISGLPTNISKAMKYSALNLELDEGDILVEGNSNLADSVESFLHAMLLSGKSEPGAYKVLPARTAVYTSIGCKNFNTFYDNLENVMKKDAVSYKEYKANVNRIEKLLRISLKDNFYSWMGDEVSLSQNQSSGITNAKEYIITIHADNIDKAKKNLDYVAEQVKKRTPAHFQTVTYKEYEIKYLEVTGLFKALLGNFFNKVEKPYYTIIDDYVLFSNKPETIISLIDDYSNKETLGKNDEFTSFLKRCNGRSSLLCYVNGSRFFNTLKTLVKGESRNTVVANKKYIVCFRHLAFQLTANDEMFETRLVADFKVPAAMMMRMMKTKMRFAKMFF